MELLGIIKCNQLQFLGRSCYGKYIAGLQIALGGAVSAGITGIAVFGISNQLLASVTLLIGTTMLLRMNKTKYAWITAAPGIFMTFITFWAGIWLIMYQYIPTQKYLLASLSVLVMVMMGFVIIGTLRRWSVLLKETKIVRDPYGDEVKEIVQE